MSNVVSSVVTSGSSCAGTATIPNSVTSIGEGAFAYATALTSITIPNSVTSIDASAFYNASSLASITIPNSVTSIDAFAFYNASSLASITIPNSVTSIDRFAFSYATALTSITIPNSVTSIGEGAFAYASSLASITIPNSVTSIDRFAFYNASSLASITIPNSVTSIDEYAFYYATALTSITIPNSVTSIDRFAFSYATALTSITIPNSVTSIGLYAFYDASSLTTFNFEGNAPATVGNSAFNSIGPNPIAKIGFLATGFGEGPTWEGLTISRSADASPTAEPRGVGGGQFSDLSLSPIADASSSPIADASSSPIADASSSPIADSEPTPPAPYAGPLPSKYSPSTPSIGEEVTIMGERLNLVDTCTIDGIAVQISNQSADSFTIVIPAGLEPGLKDLVMTGPSGKLTAQGALTIQQPKVEITSEALVLTKLNAGSFNGYVAVYAKGHKGKTLSWKVRNKWFKTTLTSDYQVFQRKFGTGRDLRVEIFVDSEQSMTKVVTSR
jgi:hypothetical protein